MGDRLGTPGAVGFSFELFKCRNSTSTKCTSRVRLAHSVLLSYYPKIQSLKSQWKRQEKQGKLRGSRIDFSDANAYGMQQNKFLQYVKVPFPPTKQRNPKIENRVETYLNISDYMQFEIFYLYLLQMTRPGRAYPCQQDLWRSEQRPIFLPDYEQICIDIHFKNLAYLTTARKLIQI